MQTHNVEKSGGAPPSPTAETPKITSADLFKQLTTYADAITAFSFVQAVGFIYAAAGNNDFGKRVLETNGTIATTIGIVLGTSIYLYFVRSCISLANSIPVRDSDSKVLESIETGRLIVICLGGVLSLVALWLLHFNPPHNSSTVLTPDRLQAASIRLGRVA
jgi:hypothetical protein